MNETDFEVLLADCVPITEGQARNWLSLIDAVEVHRSDVIEGDVGL